ncbi:MAG: phosphoenolpyruvate--protein phosphotransferase [Candidatus Ancillula sp.]|jgi:phosphotransferase system enzyme I (PtsI)|nr:phosphoenolpyruvate--protein phosphotransferase [Candidatus Ancillula sp.]
MNEFYGENCSDGTAVGTVYLMVQSDPSVADLDTAPLADAHTFESLKNVAKKQLDDIYQKTLSSLGEEKAGIIDVQRIMLEDPSITSAVEAKLNDNLALSDAVEMAFEEVASTFDLMEDEYFSARAADVRDLKVRLNNILSGKAEDTSDMPDSAIIVAEDITPSQTLSMDKSKIAGFVLSGGNQTSHTAILARSLGIPALIKVANTDQIESGATAIIDTSTLKLTTSPNGAALEDAMQKIQTQVAAKNSLNALKGVDSKTTTGKSVKLYANIGSLEDAQKAVENDAEGIGLFRTEFLYLGKDDAPSEDEQFEIYRDVAKVVSQTKNAELVIRTCDIGADKKVDYLNLPDEENPALGYRATRFMLDREELFLTQLRAIYRAAKEAVNFETHIAIMFPMIASRWEVEKCRELCQKAATEVGAPFDIAEIGIMIETPAAAVIADDLAKVSDFFSVGTNDLTQYTLAVDRQSTPELEKYSDPHHPAILRLLENIAKAANEAGIWAGICGELGGDEALTKFFLDTGFKELSMSSNKILKIRKNIVEM